MTYIKPPILFYIIVNILILTISAVIYSFQDFDGDDNGLTTMSLVYLLALGIAFWFYFKTNESRNFLVGISFIIYILIFSVYPYYE